MNKRLALILFVYVNIVVSLHIECEYGMFDSSHAMGDKYRCLVKSNLDIDSPEGVQIETLSGSHVSGKSNDDEIHFHISRKPIQYFPRGMEKFYKHLIGIIIWHTQLKEIHQDDLKSYPNLNNLYLSDNNIEIIEDELFAFNPNMEIVIFENMKIFHISPTVFDNLIKLSTLYLGGNTCINKSSVRDRTASIGVIKTVKSSCTSSDFLNLKRKLENFEEVSGNSVFANSPIFSQNVINFQAEFKDSKFANFSPLKQKFQKLIDLKIKHPYEDIFNNLSVVFSGVNTNTNVYSTMDEKLSNLKIKQDNEFSEIQHKLSSMKKKIEQDLEDTQQNILNSVDSKIEDLENRLTRKIEEILDEKLEKVMTNIRKIVTSL